MTQRKLWQPMQIKLFCSQENTVKSDMDKMHIKQII